MGKMPKKPNHWGDGMRDIQAPGNGLPDPAAYARLGTFAGELLAAPDHPTGEFQASGAMYNPDQLLTFHREGPLDAGATRQGILDGWQPPGWSLARSGLGVLLDPQTIAQIDFGGPARGNVAGTAAPELDAAALQSIDRAPAPMMAARAAKSHGTDSQVEEVTATAYRLKRDVAGKPMPDLPNMVARDKWARYAPEASKLVRQEPSNVREIVLHHTGNPSTAQEVEAIHRHHDGLAAYARDAGALLGITDSYKKNGDVGYHYLIAPDGTIYEGRSIYYQGAHAKGHNPNTIGIAFIGNYQDKPLPQAAMDSLAALTASLEAATGNRLYHSTHGLYDARKDGELRGAFGQIDSLAGPKPMNR